ncbi:GntR family transcriptional regulator [Salibacterium halotolerans]|uniref:DNA-binding transcriptional regulator YhcF, GntR family n=1 Tax=Salibacterium halotolerans TaxID=1884432 RepID=A0A1I5XZN0_9BACI|nr:GntR family transcriptional regulator [Salibacterium halotolerans]SFQ37167.1 DNA-binding transcriptional regulator YhcF, GntR family [Salibacterium halotolerans]
MNKGLEGGKPIFQQIRDRIEDQIVNDQLQEEDQIPSTNQLVQFYKINHLTAAKGINLLVDDGIIYKKRGVGMFVAAGAKSKVTEKRKNAFFHDYVLPMVEESRNLQLSEEEVNTLIQHAKGRNADDI